MRTFGAAAVATRFSACLHTHRTQNARARAHKHARRPSCTALGRTPKRALSLVDSLLPIPSPPRRRFATARAPPTGRKLPARPEMQSRADWRAPRAPLQPVREWCGRPFALQPASNGAHDFCMRWSCCARPPPNGFSSRLRDLFEVGPSTACRHFTACMGVRAYCAGPSRTRCVSLMQTHTESAVARADSKRCAAQPAPLSPFVRSCEGSRKCPLPPRDPSAVAERLRPTNAARQLVPSMST